MDQMEVSSFIFINSDTTAAAATAAATTTTYKISTKMLRFLLGVMLVGTVILGVVVAAPMDPYLLNINSGMGGRGGYPIRVDSVLKCPYGHLINNNQGRKEIFCLAPGEPSTINNNN